MNSASPASRRSNEIKIDENQTVLNSAASSDGRAFYVALTVGLLAATCGLMWIILKEPALQSSLAWLGESTGNRQLDSKPGSSSLEQTSARMPDLRKEDRHRIRNRIIREIGSDAPAELQNPKLSSASTTSVGTAPLSRVASKDSTIAQRHTVEELWIRTKFTPVPETRPTTIEGWTLHEVTNGAAVLEGPDGVWKVTPGQTVPGIGRVDSIVRWGNRLIVATSRGLISTP